MNPNIAQQIRDSNFLIANLTAFWHFIVSLIDILNHWRY